MDLINEQTFLPSPLASMLNKAAESLQTASLTLSQLGRIRRRVMVASPMGPILDPELSSAPDLPGTQTPPTPTVKP